MRRWHGGKQPVPERPQTLSLVRRTIAIRPLHRHIKCCEFPVADALCLKPSRIVARQVPSAPTLVIFPHFNVGEYVLERAHHPLRGPVITAELRFDIIQ
jgi:hypothetical protein